MASALLASTSAVQATTAPDGTCQAGRQKPAVRYLCAHEELGAGPTLTVSTPKFGNVFFSNEPKTVDITVSTGATGPFRGDLTVHVVDAYGTDVVATTTPVSVAAGSADARTITLESELNGLFTVDVRLTASDASVPLTKSTTLAVVPPLVTPGLDDASGIGYYLCPAPLEVGQAEDIAGQLQHFGVKWVRLNYVWRDGRTTRPDTSDPGWLDTAAYETWVDALRTHGIQVVCQISGLARWASSQPDRTGANEFGVYPIYSMVMPATLTDWQLFIETLAGRLAGRVSHFELMNEPDGTVCWMGTPGEFAVLTQATATALKAVDRTAKLVVNFANPHSQDFQNALFSGAGSSFDIFGFHYGDGGTVAATRDLLASYGLEKPFWNTESYGNTADFNGSPGQDCMFSHWLRQRAEGAGPSLHFVYHLSGDREGSPEITRFGRYPVNQDYTPRAHALALRTMSDAVGHSQFLSTFRVGKDATSFVFEDATRATVVLLRGDTPAWGGTPGVMGRLTVPRGVHEIAITDVMGNTQILAVAHRRVNIPLDGNPVFIEGIDPQRAHAVRLRRLITGRPAAPLPRPLRPLHRDVLMSAPPGRGR